MGADAQESARRLREKEAPGLPYSPDPRHKGADRRPLANWAPTPPGALRKAKPARQGAPPRGRGVGDHVETLPLRFLRRRMIHLAAAMQREMAGAFGGDFKQAVYFYTLMLSGVAHLPYDSPEARRAAEGLDAPEEGLRRPTTMAALAASLQQSPETVRRHVMALQAQGLCEKVEGGFVVPGRAVASGPPADAMRRFAPLVNETLERMAAFGVDLDAIAGQIDSRPPDAPEEAPSDLVQARVMLDLYLRVLEQWKADYGTLLDSFIIATIIAENTNHFDDDPSLGLRYAWLDTQPPDAERRPITVMQLSRLVGAPYATLRRRLAHFMEISSVVSTPQGLIVPAAALDADNMMQLNASALANASRLLVELRRLGRPLAAKAA